VEKFVGYIKNIPQVLQETDCWLYKKEIAKSIKEISLCVRNKMFILTKPIRWFHKDKLLSKST
jgi:hypothetical protein